MKDISNNKGFTPLHPENLTKVLRGKWHVGQGVTGFTFVEVLIAIAILAIAVIGLASMSGNAYRGVDSAKKLSAASNLAESKLEALRAMAYAKLEITGLSSESDSGGITRTCTPPYACSGNTALSSISSANGSITRACPASGTGCTTVYTCIPTTAEPPINSVTYTWFWKTMIVNADGNGECSSSGDGLKIVDMYVQWTDTFGTRTAQLQTLRAK
ncbi:MAG: prepilin-type N-terminal cleavage/methylation domain-containing protein [Deltaproteobacteria bacterium]|nr:prepilin-type N-terminal cleavage/methylation domain-containing protein [Deltaproteobacteria bacterium]